jgi:CHAT domain-containing protein/Tfp pilus assembly protein PilF
MRYKLFQYVLVLSFSVSIIHISSSQGHLSDQGGKAPSLQDTVLAAGYLEKGFSLLDKAEYDSAAHYLNLAKEIYESLSGEFDHESVWTGLVRTLNWIGMNLLRLEKYDDAMNRVTTALNIGLNKFGENHSEVARTFHSIGILYLEKRDYDNAAEAFKKSLSVKLALSGEENLDAAASYHNIGVMYFWKGDHLKSLDYNDKALSIRLRILGEDHPVVAASYNNIGNIYLQLGMYDESLEYHRKALSVRKNHYREEHPVVLQSYTNIGRVYEHKRDFDRALEQYQKVLSLGLEHSNRNFATASYKNIGTVHMKNGSYDEALDFYFHALSALTDESGAGGDFEYFLTYSEIYQLIGEAYYKKRDFDNALSYCHKSIAAVIPGYDATDPTPNPPFIEVRSESHLLNALSLKANIYSGMSEMTGTADLETALSTYRLAVGLIDTMRVGYRHTGSKLLLTEQAADIYDRAILASLNLYGITNDEMYKGVAFYFAEKSKAAVLQEGLSDIHAKQFAGIPDYLIEEERQLRVDLAFYETQLQKQNAIKDNPDKIKIAEYDKQLFDLKLRYGELISHFENNYPDYYNLKYGSGTISVGEIQYRLPVNTAMVQYFVGDDAIYIFTVSRHAFDIFSVTKPVGFSETVRDFYTSILKTETEKYIRTANELTETLISPIRGTLSDTRNLVIIPHDLLYKVPFEALFTTFQPSDRSDYTAFEYLINEFDVSYHYSATLYSGGIKSDSLTAIAERYFPDNFVGFAPVFAENDMTGYTLVSTDIPLFSDELMRSVTVDGKKFNELRYSEWEVTSIIDLLAKNTVNSRGLGYFYSDATEENFKANAGDYRIIHIASHSFINETYPQISGIVFAHSNDPGSTDDGVLYAGEIYNLNLNADLVVLSSCESGLGKLIRGEGMMALNRGFLYAGASNIVFSLWKVPDKPTSELMVGFYQHMTSGKSYAESLRRTKLQLIADPATARPRSWASFLLIGGGRLDSQ